MNKSETTAKLTAALIKALNEMPSIHKDGTNPHFRSNYATLSEVVNQTGETLRRHGLVVVQTFDRDNLETTLMHDSGEFIAGSQSMMLLKPDPQSYASASTYARRYGLLAILGLAAEDDDAESAMSRDKPKGADWQKFFRDNGLKLETVRRKLLDEGAPILSDDLPEHWPADVKAKIAQHTDKYK